MWRGLVGRSLKERLNSLGVGESIKMEEEMGGGELIYYYTGGGTLEVPAVISAFTGSFESPGDADKGGTNPYDVSFLSTVTIA